MSEERIRHALLVADPEITEGVLVCTPWGQGDRVGWAVTNLATGEVVHVYTQVVGDSIRFVIDGNFNPPKLLHEWQPQTEREEE